MSLRTIRQFQTLPSLPTRGPVPPSVSVIIPLDRTNLITNPSIELATTNYTAVGGSVARSAVDQYHGTYSLAITPSAGTNSDGAYYGTVALTTGVGYAYSCKFRATGTGIGKTYALSVATTGGVDLHVTTVVATGRWQWIRGVYGETATASRRIYLRKVNHSAASVFYGDGFQVESCADGILDATTYIDGDQLGVLVGQQPPAYRWNGTPHASTSYRTSLTRAGGYLVNLETAYNYLLTGIIGLGMAVPNNVSIPYTVLDGARYQRTTKPPRTFSLPGRFQADDLFSLRQAQSDMRAALDRDLIPLQQPLVLQVEPRDDCGNVIGDFAQVPCLYAGGLEGDDGNLTAEDAAPTFTMYIPYLSGGDGGAAFVANGSIANANAILQRSPSGVWSAMETGMTAGASTIYALTYGLDGTLYAGGSFTSAGASGADFLAKWDGAAWSVVRAAAALNAEVFALATGPDGRIYVGGNFTNADGIAAADYIAVYDPVANTYAALGTGAGGLNVNALVFDRLGNLYAGGAFPSMGGVANTVGIAMWNGTAWSALSTGLTGANPTAFALAVSAANTLYLTGAFTTAGGVAGTLRIASWNGTAFAPLASGLNNTGQALTIGPNGLLYVGGMFTSAGGVSANYIATWNGTAFRPLGASVNNSVQTLAFDAAGMLYVGGTFSTAGGNTLPDTAARWNGSSWLPLDIDLPPVGSFLGSDVYAALPRPDGGLILGFNTTGVAAGSVQPAVVNRGPVATYPKVTITGPTADTSKIYQIVNYTTGIGVYFNLTMSVGEVVTLDFDPGHQSFTSSFHGDITSTILPGSQPSFFYLAPGANAISFMAEKSSPVARMTWQTRYNGVADLVN